MKVVADEGVDRPIVDRLRQTGHRVWYVAELAPGLEDDAVLTLANQEAAVLMTAEKGFGEFIYRQRRVTEGVMLLRLAGLTPSRKAEIVTQAIQRHEQVLPQAFTVIGPRAIRIRPLRP